jgi:hypothetical protein
MFVAMAAMFAVASLAGMVMGWPWIQIAGFTLMMAWLVVDGATSLMLDKSERLIRVAAWITGMIPVTIMDFAHDERQTLVRAQPDGSYIGPLSLTLGPRIGTVRLLPNGVVDGEHGNAHCYIWRPVDRELEIELMLRADSWPNWSEWRRLSHKQMWHQRQALMGDLG